MKKWIIVLIVILLGFTFFNKEEEIRVRVIPNSNEACDIEIKDRVQKRLVEILNEFLDNDSYNSTVKKIEEKRTYIETELNEIDCVKVSFTNHNMGIKSYNDKVIAGDELTLLVEIKDAKGDNWWGTLYPDLLGISTDEVVEYKFWVENIGG